MSEFGYKIKNYQAGSVYEMNLGVRENYDYKDAMLINSLFSEFLVENGLNIWKDTATRDVICIEFKYGSRSYEEEIKHLKKLINKTANNTEINEYQRKDYYDKINFLIDKATTNQDKYDKKSAQQIREIFYRDGVDIKYQTHNKNGEVIEEEIIHYRMLYRTPGKAKKGSCMFIREELYEKAHEFLYMGIQLPEHNSPIVEIGAYSSLVTSSIVDTIEIPPEDILILKDVDSFFKTNVISIETDEDKHCVAVHKNDYEVKNTLFDGQALIDLSIFPEWADGYVLLRHHMTKAAAFATDIQAFFSDYFGDDYDTAVVKDMWGNEHLAKDVKVITTDNSTKFLKFGVSYEYWCDWVHKNGNRFGIVKTAHKSKLGEVQQMSYQMINALDLDTMGEVMKESLDHIYKLQSDNEVFMKYLEDNSNFSNDYEVLIALVKQDPEFTRSEYYRARKKAIIRTSILNMKSGKVLQNADNLVLVGSPYAMLLHSVGDDVEKDDTLVSEDGCIQCYTERFKPDEYLASFRSPFNSCNNLSYIHNVQHWKFTKYFKLGNQCLAVNVRHTDWNDRNNGSDFDSDSVYTTNNPAIVKHAKYCYENYPTIINNIPKQKAIYDNNPDSYSRVDNALGASQTSIGESSNIAQLALTYSHNFEDKKYKDYACILAVVAQAAIDNSKRVYDIDIPAEIKRIKADMDIPKNGYPKFWMVIRPGFDRSRINFELKCPMNYVYDLKFGKPREPGSILSMDVFYKKFKPEAGKRRCLKVEEFIEKYSLDLHINYNANSNEDNLSEYLLLRNDFDQLIEDIKQLYISKSYKGLMSWLIDRAFYITPTMKAHLAKNHVKSKLKKNRSLLLKVLYAINPDMLLECFSGNIERKNGLNSTFVGIQ